MVSSTLSTVVVEFRILCSLTLVKGNEMVVSTSDRRDVKVSVGSAQRPAVTVNSERHPMIMEAMKKRTSYLVWTNIGR